jgi:hypothetical protein
MKKLITKEKEPLEHRSLLDLHVESTRKVRIVEKYSEKGTWGPSSEGQMVAEQ